MGRQAVKKQRSLVANLFIWAIIGVLIIWSAYQTKVLIVSYFNSNQSASWPSVSGVVLEKRIEPWRRASHGGLNYSCYIEYKFFVSGEEYISKRMSVYSFEESYETHKEALELSDALPNKGQAIEVFYKPNDPAFAIVYRYKKPVWRLLLTIMIWWAAALAFFFIEYRKFKLYKAAK